MMNDERSHANRPPQAFATPAQRIQVNGNGHHPTHGNGTGHSARPSGETYLLNRAAPPSGGERRPESLRLVLVSENESQLAALSAALSLWPTSTQVFWAAEAGQAATRVQELLPHVVVVDVDSVVEPGRLIRYLSTQAPQVALLALVDGHEVADARQAVLAGARGFVTRPLVADDLVATLRHVLEQRPTVVQAPTAAASAALGNVIVFLGPKGGTGRTTALVNTAAALHKSTGESVVIMDADWAAPAVDVALNLRDERDIGDLLSRLARLDDELLERVLARHASGLRVLLAPPPGELHENLSPTQMVEVVAALRRRFAWVLVDIGLPLDEAALAVLHEAGRVVITVLPELVGLRNARLLLGQLRGAGIPVEHTWLVLNRATIRGGIARKDIEERLKIKVFQTIPDDQPLASLSINRGVPLVLSHPRSAVARSIQELAQHLLHALEPARGAQPTTGPAQPGLWARLRRGLARGKERRP